MTDEGGKANCALALSGGGARGAYEAGVIHYLRTGLPPELGESTLFNILSGTSVGAINTAFMASTAHDPIFQGTRIRRLWRDLSPSDIYHTDINALIGTLVKTGYFTATNFLGFYKLIESKLGKVTSFPFKGVLDTTPFVHYLRRNIFWKEIHRNIERGIIDAVTVTATQMTSGRAVVFVEKRPEIHYRPGALAPVYGQISPKHILASAAIPIIFPLIRINQTFYGDGSLRQNTPLSPALNLGADRVLIISLVTPPSDEPIGPEPASGPSNEPALGDITGQLLDSLFLDKLDYDLRHLKWVNYLLRDIEAVFGKDGLEKLNEFRANLDIPGHRTHAVQKVTPFVIAPSEDMGAIAARHLKRIVREKRVLSPMQRFFQKILDGSPDETNDLVSFLLFDRGYLEELIQLGYEDARRNHDHLVRFFTAAPELPTPVLK